VQDLLDIRPLGWPRNCHNTTLDCFLSHSGGLMWMLGWLMTCSILKYALRAWKNLCLLTMDKAISQPNVDAPFVWDTLLCVLENHTVLLPRNKHFRKSVYFKYKGTFSLWRDILKKTDISCLASRGHTIIFLRIPPMQHLLGEMVIINDWNWN
jgi:hypothetical protein